MELMPDHAPRVARFGVFEVDLRAGELRRNGVKVKVQNQPFQILAMLLERPGEIITRDEMRSSLWPAETFVDFDHGLNSAIRRLRDAMGDSAEAPTFIETVGRRGYRFVFPVDGARNNGDGAVATVVPISGAALRSLPRLSPSAVGGLRKRRGWMLASASFLVIAAAFIAIQSNRLSQTSFGKSLRRIGLRPAAESSTSATQRQLTANPAEVPVTSSALSPDGKYLAYSDKTGLYIRQISTSDTHPVPLPPGFSALLQSWFPDSSHMVVSHVADNGKPPGLWVISILGGSPRQLTDDGAGARVSPDGSKILFLRSAIGRNEIWLMQADGVGQHRILDGSTADQVYFSPAAWASDGIRFAFIRTVIPVYNAADPTGVKRTLEIIDSVSGHREVAVAGQEIEGAFGWTADDALIYSINETAPHPNEFSLWRVPIDAHTLRPRSAAVKLTSGYGWATDLTIASNGKLLALRRVEPNSDAYIADVDAGTNNLSPKRLTLDDRADYVFGWTADSNSVLFLSDRNGPMQLYKQALDQTQPELVVGGDNVLAIPRIGPSGNDVFYLLMPRHRESSDGVKIMRVPLAGGVPQPILEAPGIWNYQCAHPPSTLCIYSPTDPNIQRFFAFDPVTGASHEIKAAQMRTDPERPNWSLAADGSRLAIRILRAEGDAAIKVLSLSDGSDAMILLPGWPRMAGIDWAPDGNSLWVAASRSRADGSHNCALLNVSTGGLIHVEFQEEGLCFLAGIPSPDGRHLALEGVRPSRSNVWLLENF